MNATLTPHIENHARKTVTLQELKDKALPRLNYLDIIKIKEGGKLADEDAKSMSDYFLQFLPPGPCVKCGKNLTGDIMDQFIGRATFTWGLAHGEGFCRECKYPARAYHRNVGPIEFVNLVLQYHPDELEAPEVCKGVESSGDKQECKHGSKENER